MTNESAVQFESSSRIHMGLAVNDLKKAVAFYEALFAQAPTKTRPGYARFEVAQPRVNLSLSEVRGQTGPNNPITHFGIQVKSTGAVREVAHRLEKSGLATRLEESVTCCYAVQDKVWATDPDGNQWEVYVVLDDQAAHHQSSAGGCCPQLPAVIQAVQQGDLTAAMTALQRAGGITGCSCMATP